MNHKNRSFEQTFRYMKICTMFDCKSRPVELGTYTHVFALLIHFVKQIKLGLKISVICIQRKIMNLFSTAEKRSEYAIFSTFHSSISLITTLQMTKLNQKSFNTVQFTIVPYQFSLNASGAKAASYSNDLDES